MKPLVVLLVVFGLSCLGFYVSSHDPAYIISGRIAMSIMLLFTAVGHFAFYQGMTMTVPPYIPFKKFMVYFTAVLEIAAAFGLLLIGTHYYTAVFLIVFFVALLPSNIYAAQKHVNLEKANFSGNGPSYLWFRIPLQLFFIAWVWFFAILR
jgi:uncharacterized membrane protein